MHFCVGGWVAYRGQQSGVTSNNPDVWGSCSGPDRMGVGPHLGRTIQRGRRQTGPPAAIEVCPSDQLRLSLKPSLDFNLWEGAEKGTHDKNRESRA